MRFISNYDTPISEHMTSEKLVTAPVETDLETAESILLEHRIEKLPLGLMKKVVYQDLLLLRISKKLLSSQCS